MAADLESGWRVTDRLAGVAGFVRSLAIYHGQPWRTRALARHYAAFVGPGDLAFDVGAHVGNHARCLARLGVRVLAIEPQPAFARWLRWLFRDRPEVTVIESALAAAPGMVALHPSPATPSVATASRPWIDRVSTSTGFGNVRWAEALEVPALTLDVLIAHHGLPRLCKIDVEGYEAEVLSGLSQPIPLVTFEYLPAAIDVAVGAAARLAALGRYRFKVTVGERRRLLWPDWRPAGELEAWLRERRPNEPSGDVHACLEA